MFRLLNVRPKQCGFDLAAIESCVHRNVGSTCSVIDNTDATRNLRPYKDIPGPASFPLIGPMLSFLPGGSLSGLRGVDLAEQLYKQYGKIVKIKGFAGNEDLIWIFDADAMEYVYRSENALPYRITFPSLDYYRQRHNKVFDPDRVIALTTLQGEKWWNFRSKVNHIMLQPKTIMMYKDVLAEVANDMIARIRCIRTEKDMIEKNFNREMNLWALESVGVVALGTRLNCLDPNLPEDSASKDLIRTVHELFDLVDKLDIGLSPWKYISTPTFRKAMKVFEEQEGLTKYFIDKAMKNMEESEERNGSANNGEKAVMEKLLEVDYDIAHAMASDMLIAGVDTASNTAIATFYLLAKNSDKQNKLREEVLSQKTSRPYLRACIKESMRLMPVVYANARLATKDYNILGYKVPKNVTVIFPHQFLSMSEEHYPRADEFIPERWLVEKDDPLHHGNTHPFVTAPFGFGTRVCLGRRIAELEINTLISEVLKNFHIGWEGGPPNIHSSALNYVTEPFNFTFKDI